MGKYLDQSGVEALWNKVKAHFGASLSVSGTTITLKNKAATPASLSQVTLPDATTSSAGAMSAADKAKLDGVASGATANAGTITSVKVGAASAVTSGAVSIPSASTSAEGVVKLGTGSSNAAAGDHSHSAATQTSAGMMSAADKKKLDGIDEGANAYELPAATTTALGGFKAGSFLSGESKSDQRVRIDQNGYAYVQGAGTYGQLGLVNIKRNGGLSLGVSADVSVNCGTALAVGDDGKLNVSLGTTSDTAAAGDHTHSAATQSAAGMMSAADKKKLDGVEEGANYFKLTCGDSTFDGEVEISAGPGILVRGNGGDEVMQILGVAATSGSMGMMTAADKAKLDGVAAGATANTGTITSVKVGSAAAVASGAVTIPSASTSAEGVVKLGTTSTTAAAGDHAHSTYAPKASPALSGTPTAPTAAAGTSTTQIATTAFVQSAIKSAQTGAAMYKGTLSKASDLTGLAYHEAGWYWVVAAAGTYAGEACEAGDMVFCNETDQAYDDADFDVVQANIQAMTAAEVEAVCV